LFDAEGNCVWQAEQSLWGETDVLFARKPDGYQPLVDCNLRFQNQWEDEESGLHYNLNRYYDPDSGQYLSPDPIGLEGGLRTHGYVHDPMQWVDPLGLAGCPKVSAPKKPIIVGENMKRVKLYAEKTGGQAYNPWKNDPFNKNLGMKRNKRWIQDMKREGRDIIDIGPDLKRRSLGTDPSDFYNMERTQLKDYGNYTKVFERNGTKGGVPGIDF
jgi:RHS repeat-associated protein